LGSDASPPMYSTPSNSNEPDFTKMVPLLNLTALKTAGLHLHVQVGGRLRRRYVGSRVTGTSVTLSTEPLAPAALRTAASLGPS